MSQACRLRHYWAMRIDLHTHSNISDGTDSPAELVLNAQANYLDVIGLCDHDTFGGLDEAQRVGSQVGVRVVRGIEMSTQVEDIAVHLLGYGMDVTDQALNLELERIRESRAGRVAAICENLTRAGLPITEEEVFEQAAKTPSVGRPHVADVMVRKGYVANRDEAFTDWLTAGKPGYVKRYAPDLEVAIDLLRKAGGATVIAHPWGRASRTVLTPEYLEILKTDHGLDGIEVDHVEHDFRTQSELSALADQIGLLRTGGSDYHGTGKLNNPLGVHLTRPSILEEIETRVMLRGGQL